MTTDLDYSKAKAYAMENYYKGDDESRLVESGEYRGYTWKIRTTGSHPCAYVELPDGHPLRGMEYEDVDLHIGRKVNGGLTYGSETTFGWDYAHCDDFVNFGSDYYKSGGHIWTRDEILAQIRACIDDCIYADRYIKEQREGELERERDWIRNIIIKARLAEHVDEALIDECFEMAKHCFCID